MSTVAVNTPLTIGDLNSQPRISKLICYDRSAQEAVQRGRYFVSSIRLGPLIVYVGPLDQPVFHAPHQQYRVSSL